MTKKAKTKMPPHPMQPVIRDENGIHRFRANKIVEYLLDNGGIDMNHIAATKFPKEDRMQFLQLIGFSVCGYCEFECVSDISYKEARRRSEQLAKQTKKEKKKNA